MEIINEREKLIEDLSKLSIVTKIYPTDANFVLVKTIDAEKIYKFLLDEQIVVRNRNNVETLRRLSANHDRNAGRKRKFVIDLKKITDKSAGISAKNNK